jgi:hypothetical protein
MNCYGYQEELNNLMDLVKFKEYRRYGPILYAKYEVVKPECSILELVWGWCRNPVFAARLTADLEAKIPNCETFSKVLAKSNRLIDTDNLNRSFDQAMRQVCNKREPSLMSFTTESTNLFDVVDTNYQLMNGTDDDGELWHGVLIENENEWKQVSDITITIYKEDPKYIVWEQTFSAAEVRRNTKRVNDVVAFLPFKHPLLILNMDILIETRINFYEDSERTPLKQIFGIGSNDFCNWLSDACFETKLCNGYSAVIDVQESTIIFKN